MNPSPLLVFSLRPPCLPHFCQKREGRKGGKGAKLYLYWFLNGFLSVGGGGRKRRRVKKGTESENHSSAGKQKYVLVVHIFFLVEPHQMCHVQASGSYVVSGCQSRIALNSAFASPLDQRGGLSSLAAVCLIPLHQLAKWVYRRRRAVQIRRRKKEKRKKWTANHFATLKWEMHFGVFSMSWALNKNKNIFAFHRHQC